MRSKLEKQGKNYTFRYYDNKLRKRKTLSTSSLFEAKKKLQEIFFSPIDIKII
jgi:hypothetical protein